MDGSMTAPDPLAAKLARIVRVVEAHEKAAADPAMADDPDEDPAE